MRSIVIGANASDMRTCGDRPPSFPGRKSSSTTVCRIRTSCRLSSGRDEAGSRSDSAMLDHGPHEGESHAEQPHRTLDVPKGDVEPPAPVEPEDGGARNPSEWREPKGRRCDQTGLWTLTIDEHSEDEDET